MPLYVTPYGAYQLEIIIIECHVVHHVVSKFLYHKNISRANRMDDSATLDVIDGGYNAGYDSDDEDSTAEMWGRCFPIGKGFTAQGTSVL